MNSLPYTRWSIRSILHALSIRRVVLLEGPRQCGKTTLSQHLDINAIYRTLDDEIFLQAALDDPGGFIKHGDELMIIDEIQRAPRLLLAIKKEVDEVQVYGRFLLTGSANIWTLPSVTESLAGRIRKIRLRPLAIGEIQGKTPDFLTNVFAGKLQDVYYKSECNKEAYLGWAFKGGYPEAVRCDTCDAAQLWHLDYISTMMERDLRDIINIRRKDSLHKLVGILAAWSSKFMDISKIMSHLSVNRQTIESYINVLE